MTRPPLYKGQYGVWFLYVTARFDAECKAAALRSRRFQDVYGRLRTVLTSDPSQNGHFAPLTDAVVVSEADPHYLLPSMRIRYRFHDTRIVLIDIEVG